MNETIGMLTVFFTVKISVFYGKTEMKQDNREMHPDATHCL